MTHSAARGTYSMGLLTLIVSFCGVACSSDTQEAKPKPQVQLSAKEFVEGDRATTSLSTFRPGDYLLVQCRAVAVDQSKVAESCDMTQKTLIAVDSSTTASGAFPVRRYIAVGTRREIDCAIEPCAVAALAGPNEIVDTAEFSVMGGTTDDAPTLRLGSESGRRGALTIAVRGDGFEPGLRYNLVQCPGSESRREVSAEDCLYDESTSVVASSAGDFSTRVRIFAQFESSEGSTIDCEAPKGCVLASVWPPPADSGRMAIERLSLGSP